MFVSKNATGLWKVLPVVSCAAALLSVCVCACVVFSAKQDTQTSAMQSAQQQQNTAETDATSKDAAQGPQFRAFNDGLEVLQNGIWVPIKALDQMQQSDPLSVALQAYMKENGMTSAAGEVSKHLEETGSPGGREPMMRGRVPQKRDDRRDDTSEESDAYL